jgi:putative selenium metabolism hydrolase
MTHPSQELDNVIEFTRDLVRIPSVLGTEGEVAEAVRERMEKLGFDLFEIDPVGNTVGLIEGEEDGPTLLFDAHMDTVDVLPREAWTYDPFSAERVGNRIYGRGTADMKGALAAMVIGAGTLNRAHLAGRIIVSASVEEESIEGMALREVMRRYDPDYVVIGEASELNLVRAGRGRAEFLVEVPGKPAHASSPHLGKNAIHAMRAAIDRIEKLEPGVHPFVGSGVFCLTDIISTPYPAHSVVPSGCTSTYERRLVPGETQEQVQQQFLEACFAAGIPDASVELVEASVATYTGHLLTQPKWFPPWEMPEDSLLVQRALQGLRDQGLDPGLASYRFCTNGAYSAGMAGVPTIGFGPAAEPLAHIVDEYVEVEQLELAYKGYQGIAQALLRA